MKMTEAGARCRKVVSRLDIPVVMGVNGAVI